MADDNASLHPGTRAGNNGATLTEAQVNGLLSALVVADVSFDAR